MYTLRTRFKKDIVCEFVVPKKASHKAIIFCDGMPGVPGKRNFMDFLVQKGFCVFFPRYRGTWESGGTFLSKSPERDIIDVVDGLKRQKIFVDLWTGQKISLDIDKIFVVGVSFGGAAALLASLDSRVKKVVAISPVVDWRAPSKEEPLNILYTLVKKSFGAAYRMNSKNWKKLNTGKFFNPAVHTQEFDKNKIWIFHAKDDKVVSAKSVEKFAKKVGCNLSMQKRGGHLSSKILLQKRIYTRIRKFLQ